MATANIDLGINAMEEVPLRDIQREPGVTRQYQACEMLPDKKTPLDDLLRKQPAVLGSLQMVSGLFSVGIGIFFAVSQSIDQSLFTLFRVSQMTGILFLFAGLVSNMLFKYPKLLSVSIMLNSSCICVAFIATPLIIVDLTKWNYDLEHNEFLKIEIFELCILGFESCLSAILCFWFVKEKRKHSKEI